MHIPGLFLAVSLSFAGAAADVPEGPEVMPAAAAKPEPTTDTPPARPEPKHKGIGLAATAGVLGGASLGVTIARSVLLKKNCPLDSMSPTACTYDFGSDIGLAATQWTLNLGTVGFAPAAGTILGRHHAWKDAQSGRAPRNVKAIMGAGGGLLGVGIVGVGTSVALAFVLPTRCLEKELEGTDPLEGDRCLLKAFPAWTMTNWASFTMISTGAGMLGYGNAYKKSRPTRVSQIKVAPYAGRTYAGIGLAGRF